MFAIIFQVLGVTVFVTASAVCGKLIRSKPNMEYARKPIRTVHFCFWFFLSLPAGIELVYPGYTRLDGILGLKSLPNSTVFLVIGIIIFLLGVYYQLMSNKLLAQIGKGAAAFKFSKHAVKNGVYAQVRNPMALGYYLSLLGIGLMARSTYFTLFTLLVVIPAHIFYIKYFEEFEVELRLGESYRKYKQATPFLIPKIFVGRTKPLA